MLLPIRFGIRLAIAGAIVGVAAGGANIATGSTGHSLPRRTVTVARAMLATTKRSRVSALVSKHGPKTGPYVAMPSSLDLIYGYRSDVAAAHLKWVDWGQPVAFATGDILIETSTGRFESVPGAIVLTGLTACGTKPTYYYKSATAYTPTYYKYTAVSTGKPQLASPC
jgi:hypothetical protein